MIAVTFYGPNTQGFPEGFPKSARPDAEELLDGESALMSDLGYAQFKADWDGKFTAARPKDELLAEVRAAAQRRICGMLGYAPEDIAGWAAKEINMVARGSELVRAEGLGTITNAEAAELAQLNGFFAKVKLVRAHSNELGAAIAAGETPDIEAGWPEN